MADLPRMFHMPHPCVWHSLSHIRNGSLRCGIFFILPCVSHASFMCVTWLICNCQCTNLLFIARLDSLLYATWLTHTCDVTHSNAWHASVMCVTWPFHMCYITHVWHDSCGTWLIHVCGMSAECARVMGFLSFCTHSTHMNESCSTWVMSHMGDVTHMKVKNPMTLALRTNYELWTSLKVCMCYELHMTHSYVWNSLFTC